MTTRPRSPSVRARAALEAMAAKLEASGDYRVLRRITPREWFSTAAAKGDFQRRSEVRTGLILDVETTGLDPRTDAIIELGMIAFEYEPGGTVFRVTGSFSAFQDPGRPIPPEITRLTGITDEMVAGQSIEPIEVAGFAEPASVVIAHNAGFDRRFVERVWDIFRMKAWACSQSGIDWSGEGVEGTKLGYLLAQAGLFHDGHRAAEDCRALLEVLARPLPVSGVTALGSLLAGARQASMRIRAEGSPFDMKDALKARGYRWNDGSDGQPKAWWRDVAEADVEAELTFLRLEIYRRAELDIPVRRLTAFDRYSDRV
ncbi:3'-5' exonuclease [Tistrella sp. BH-R2-4]|uniref:3'-5' exonuclease n=1 Tax=Tistrella arctica TaxID=3133430 RepID=A0ABU9YNK8_9PROT